MYIYNFVDKQKLNAGKLTVKDVLNKFNVDSRTFYELLDPSFWFNFVMTHNGVVVSDIAFCRYNGQPMEFYDKNRHSNFLTDFYTVGVCGGLTFDVHGGDVIYPTNGYFTALKKKYPDVMLVRFDCLYDLNNRCFQVTIDDLANMDIEHFDLPINASINLRY